MSSTPATVVVVQRLKPGREKAFLEWQERTNKAVAEFPGYLGTELLEPDGEGEGEDAWVTVYRFGSVDQLKSWMDSEELARLREQAAELFAAPPSRQILHSERRQDTVTVVVSHRVAPGDEEAFREFQQRITEAEQQFPGFRGSELLEPVPGVQDEWTALYRYDTAEHLDAWLESPQRRRLLAEAGEHFADFELHRISPPYGSWFASLESAEEAAAAPPGWKSALSVLVGLYPTVFLLTLGLTEAWPGADLWLSLLVGNVLSVTLLTWVVMPVVTRLLRFWLAPSPADTSPRLDALGTAISIGFLTVVAAIFWLTSTQIWTLP